MKVWNNFSTKILRKFSVVFYNEYTKDFWVFSWKNLLSIFHENPTFLQVDWSRSKTFWFVNFSLKVFRFIIKKNWIINHKFSFFCIIAEVEQMMWKSHWSSLIKSYRNLKRNRKYRQKLSQKVHHKAINQKMTVIWAWMEEGKRLEKLRQFSAFGNGNLI